tara:strand:- start:2070 stop:3080 length:1011 start_codon:yes stop_codon:yes gene_type:complete
MKNFLKFLFIFLIVFESASFIFTKFEMLTFNEKPSYSFDDETFFDWIVDNDDGSKSHKENYKTKHTSRCFDVNYEFNNVGARDDEDYFFEDPKKSIVLIGDSFAEGYGVNLENTFAKVIEKKIDKKILNFGISDTNPKSQLYRYINYDSKFNYDELIYFFLPHNDYLNLNNNDEKNNEKKSFFKNLNLLNYKTKIADILSRFTYSYNFIRSASHVLDINLHKNFKDQSYFYEDVKNINYTFDFVENILNFKQVKSYIVIIPTIYDINNYLDSNINYKKLYWYKELNKLASRNNSTIIDLMEYIDFKNKHKYFHSCDGHWSVKGNLFAAKTFLEFYN